MLSTGIINQLPDGLVVVIGHSTSAPKAPERQQILELVFQNEVQQHLVAQWFGDAVKLITNQINSICD